MGWADFFACCRRAGGPVRLTATAHRCGLSAERVRRRARREGWWRPYPDVVAPPGLVVDRLAWIRAGALHASGRSRRSGNEVAAVADRSALYVLEVARTAPTVTEVVVPATAGRVTGPRLRVVRSRGLTEEDVALRRGVPILRGGPLVRLIAGRLDPARLADVVVDLVAAGHVRPEELQSQLADHRRFAGRPALRAVLRELEASGRSDSPFELELRRRLMAAGVPLDRGQVAVPDPRGGRLHLDLGIAAIRFAIEADSLAWHGSRQQLDRDAERTNVVAAAGGWQVLRATWSMLEGERWEAFVARVREVVAAQATHHLGVPWPRPGDLRR